MAKRESKVEGVNVLPELEAGFTEIKNLFKAGSVPRESDYTKLIEYVHYLHKLLGVEGSDGDKGPGLGEGLSLSSEGLLNVEVGSGIEILENKISLSKDISAYIMGGVLNATHCAVHDRVIIFFNVLERDLGNVAVARVFSRGIDFLDSNLDFFKLNSTITPNGGYSQPGIDTCILLFNDVPTILNTIDVRFSGYSSESSAIVVEINEIDYLR